MQAQHRFAQLVLPVAVALPALAAQNVLAADAAGAPAAVTAAAPATATVTVQSAAGPATGAETAAAPAPQLAAAPPASAAPATDVKAAQDPPGANDQTFGVAMTTDQLAEHRGGDALISNMNLTGSVADNVASHVGTGSNTVDGASFSNASGLPTVIQNTGANVLIQNATILNVRFGN